MFDTSRLPRIQDTGESGKQRSPSLPVSVTRDDTIPVSELEDRAVIGGDDSIVWNDKALRRRRCCMVVLGLTVLTGVLMLGFLSTPFRTESSSSKSSELSGVCFANMDDVPKEWQPPDDLTFMDSVKPWSDEEQLSADDAVMSAYWQMHNFFSGLNETQIIKLWYNGIEAFLEGAYAGDMMPELETRSLQEAVRILKTLSQKYIEDDDAPLAVCKESMKHMDLVTYAHILLKRVPDDGSLRTLEHKLVHRANKAFQDCGSLAMLLGYDPVEEMSKENQPDDEVFDWVLNSIVFTDALSNTKLLPPKGTDLYVADTWEYLEHYNFPPVDSFPEKYDSAKFGDYAYLATHSAYMPTGFGRHQLKVEDAPWLFRYLRENFYNAMHSGDIDLLSEFLDVYRTYGCTESNDAQLRHGARFLMHFYQANGYSWVPEGAKYSNYDTLHASWTGMSGLRRRVLEPVVDGSYGSAFRKAIDRWSSKATSAAGGTGD